MPATRGGATYTVTTGVWTRAQSIHNLAGHPSYRRSDHWATSTADNSKQNLTLSNVALKCMKIAEAEVYIWRFWPPREENMGGNTTIRSVAQFEANREWEYLGRRVKNIEQKYILLKKYHITKGNTIFLKKQYIYSKSQITPVMAYHFSP